MGLMVEEQAVFIFVLWAMAMETGCTTSIVFIAMGIENLRVSTMVGCPVGCWLSLSSCWDLGVVTGC